MAFETNDFIEVSNIMLQIYDTMESEMLSKFSTRLSMNAKQGVANAYHDLQAHRLELQKIIERYTGDLDESYKDMIARAFVSGVAGADIDLGGQSEWMKEVEQHLRLLVNLGVLGRLMQRAWLEHYHQT